MPSKFSRPNPIGSSRLWQPAQAGLLTKAADEKTADDVKISLYKSLAQNAKFFGNQLEGSQVDALSKTVQDAAKMMMGIFTLAGYLLAACLIGGLIFAGAFLYFRRKGTDGQNEVMTTLRI